MTSPWPNPPQLPPSPRTWPATAITVQVESCCGVLVGEYHDCPAFHAAAMAAFDNPIILPAHADVPCLTDPALLVYRPSLEMVAEMEPPLRWKVTAAGVEVGL